MPDSSPSLPFEVGDSVRVKEDADDSKVPGWNIEGWQGRIAEITDDDPPMLLIEWDSITLQEIPEDLLVEAERNGSGWRRYYLFPRDVESTEPRDAPQDVKQLRRELHDYLRWVSLGTEGRYVQRVLERAASDDERAIFHAWEDDFSKCLSFPFDATVAEFQERTPFRSGDEVRVLSSTFSDCMYGFIATVRRERETMQIPLADLEACDEASDNYLPLRAYRLWFANR
jgi:hypothetical protein